ncbi:hypothetical protein ASE12_17605 [Aeromicrobium sp. Root236]|uniref:glycoside hydrolase family 127 protein n=1 Tax=Aeromicrobium sp. Root236 TaxID=1736498 RepID=UPI0006FF28CA|nr:beta-L-arabinofuranosidase domain-containing protein [Aeromicrobium sp. Root236]KRC66420.1 hypothetical protein ASE12_17605 [Aeromicrobium sp. Root236]
MTTPLRPLAPGELTIDGGFWGDYQQLNQRAIIQHCLHWVERIGWVGNFDAAAAGGAYEHAGVEFVDSEVYKLLEAMAWELRRAPEAGLATQYKDLVARVAAAQEADGYLHTAFGHPGQRARYSDLEWGHELYCFGHLFQAAAAALRAGIESDLPRVALKLADHVHAEFGPSGREAVCGHPEIELALVELHRAVVSTGWVSTGSTGEAGDLLELARCFVDRRGHGTLGEIEFGAAYFQDDVPVRDADTLRGHAVRALYLAAGAVDVAVEDHDEQLLEAITRQWEHTVARRTYLTGGMGAHHQDEAFGEDFELPPDRAYAETCAGIASVMLSWRLLLATGDTRHADLIERTLYNNVISSPRADGKAFFYVNTLHQRVAGTVPDEEHHSARALASLRAPWFEVSCCPTNVARTLANVGMYFASASNHALHVHQYGDVTIDAQLTGGARVGVQVRTGYPYEPSVSVTLLRDLDAETSVTLRVPSWARGNAVLSDGLDRVAVTGDTVVIKGPRPAGSPYVLQLPMPPRVTHPDPRIDAIRGQVALERGPFVLAVEDVDLPGGVTVNDIEIDPAGVVPAEGGGATVPVQLSRVAVDDGELPYGDRLAVDRAPLDDPSVVTFRPYHQWANRGPSTMRVWTPVLDHDAPAGSND